MITSLIMTKKRKNEKERARSIKACEALEFQTRPSSSDYLHTAKNIFEIHPRVLEIFCGQTHTHTHTHTHYNDFEFY